MSVPVTSSDIESWDTRGQIFMWISLITFPFDPEWPNLAW